MNSLCIFTLWLANLRRLGLHKPQSDKLSNNLGSPIFKIMPVFKSIEYQIRYNIFQYFGILEENNLKMTQK